MYIQLIKLYLLPKNSNHTVREGLLIEMVMIQSFLFALSFLCLNLSIPGAEAKHLLVETKGKFNWQGQLKLKQKLKKNSNSKKKLKFELD